MGIGGGPNEHLAYGMEYPEAPERVKRLEEAVAVIRALWTGGPVTRESPYYPLSDAHAHPVPDPPPPIIVGGETRAGARLAGRIGDGWTAFYDNFQANLPAYLEALEQSGRARADQRLIVGFQGEDWLSDEPIAGSPWIEAPREEWARWQEAGADGVIVLARSAADVDALVNAVDRW
jgi:alkanesulfonate monooxygenase SsuD/methylene tetrahydromethanopterin reductase-like flavin-dependent oxidoreductase (luciferase family)